MIVRLFIFLLMFASNFAYAQKEATNWYFGKHSGLNFATSPPTLTNNSSNQSIGGLAIISDSLGKLLFYTDGITVWNSEHLVMQNGNGLKGHPGLGQSAVIVPVGQGAKKKFYIFTSDGETGSPPAFPNDSVFAFSIVDMSLNSGKGAVTIKNQILMSAVNESVAAVKHANGIDTWVMTHKLNTNDWYAYLVSKCGVSAPIISNVGPIELEYLPNFLKFSADGTKLSYSFGIGSLIQNYLFDFDNSSGLVSNALGLGLGSGIWNCSFSPNSQYLYTQGSNVSSNTVIYLNQYDLLASNVVGSLKQLSVFTILGMQLGIDGNLYILKNNNNIFIDVLHNPNAPLDTANYQSNAYVIPFENGDNINGLPNFIESYFQPGYNSVTPVNPTYAANRVCIGDSSVFNSFRTSSVQSFHWDFGEPTSGAKNYSSLANPKHLYQKAGLYKAVCVFLNSICNDTLTQMVRVDSMPYVYLGEDIEQTICNTNIITLDAGANYLSYLWQDGSNSQTFNTNNQGIYQVKVTNACGDYTASVEIQKTDYNIPNLFTPNGDNKNDSFEITSLHEAGKLSVYNSWGTEVYKNDTYDNSWNAYNVSSGVYYYSFQLSNCPLDNGWVQVIK